MEKIKKLKEIVYKKWKMVIIILFVLVFAIFGFPWLRCFILNFNEAPGKNQHVIESKENGVFINEYEIIPDTLKMPDGSIVKIEEVWTEKPWAISDRCKGIIKTFLDDSLCFFSLRLSENGGKYLDETYGYRRDPGLSWIFRISEDQMFGGTYSGHELIRYRVPLKDNYTILPFETYTLDSAGFHTKLIKTFLLRKK